MTSSRSQLPFENLSCTCLRYVRYCARSCQNKWKGPLGFSGWCSVVPSLLLLKQSDFGQEQFKVVSHRRNMPSLIVLLNFSKKVCLSRFRTGVNALASTYLRTGTPTTYSTAIFVFP